MFAASIPVDASFEMLGEDAVFDPDGAATPVRVIRSSGSERSDFAAHTISRETMIIEVRSPDATLWKNDNVIVVAGERRLLKISVGAEPEYLDDLRMVRTFDTQKE
ncbi:MAG: hypothetical protein DRP42_02995 [Tenericutes bacterium]|nr:MAG: hypothetical protein DRP42_02995 [Mycoplasmatota bacterium]